MRIKRKEIKTEEKDMTDKLEKFRGKKSCSRCHALLEDEKLLQKHREYMHGECSCNDHLRKNKKGAGENVIYHPPKKDWKRRFKKQTFIWDCWDGTYYQYELGIGLIDDLDIVVADENSKYYKTLIKIINNNTPLSKIGKQPPKTKFSSLPSNQLPAKPIKIPKKSSLCKNCHRIIRIYGPKPTNLLICPNCNTKIL